MRQYYVGVDVGTEFARACIIDQSGEILATTQNPISRSQPKQDHINQSSDEIWGAVCKSVKTAVAESQVAVSEIVGINFDATCSLVVLEDGSDAEVAVGPDFNNRQQNVILWMDHRAVAEASEINGTGHSLLQYVGGKMSVEMQMPKIKWLKRHMPAGQFARCKFYDLPDFLTYKATGVESRSFCSTVCKMGLVPKGVDGSTSGWSREFLEQIGLGELCEDNFRKLGGGLDGAFSEFKSAGEPVGLLSETAASSLGLTPQCVVGSGVIDAYAGWVGTVGASENGISESGGVEESAGRLAAVAGTSTCLIMLSQTPHFVEGVWGPYRDVLARGYWCTEGGQSCTGALLAHILHTHPAYPELHQAAQDRGLTDFDYINWRLEQLRAESGVRSIRVLAKHRFLYGDYHGNRSPLADPSMRAAMVGLSMDVSQDDLALAVLTAFEFIALQARHILDHMAAAGLHVDTVYFSGGQARNKLLVQLLADAVRRPVVTPRHVGAAVVFGSALLAAAAVENYLTNTNATASSILPSSASRAPQHRLWQIMSRLTVPGNVVSPSPDADPDIRLLDAKYKVFLEMAEAQKLYRKLVDDVENTP
ncbi:AaceriAGR092Wp [[Ashbya] aceris (nom. inval.)]|nr:AaceriAGR092Wp [[Ashbya] aceris (nom. inval.)]